MRNKLTTLTAVFIFAVSLTAVANIQPAEAAFPGANGKIAYSVSSGISQGIYVMDADGTNHTRLTTFAGDNRPNWSPDGTKIVFGSSRDGFAAIYVMNADGSNQTQITNNVTASDVDPAWSPDGSKISFRSTRDGNQEIYVMNADGTSQVNLSNNGAVDRDPNWSPDGTKIVFNSTRDGNNEIYVMNADGSTQIRLTSNVIVDFDPNWSPDGTKIAFRSDRDGNGEIYTMNADGSAPTRLTNNAALDINPAWSPDGTKISFMSQRDVDQEVYVMNADGSAQLNLTNNPGISDAIPDWQPFLSPQANDDAGVTTAGQAVTVDVLANDTDTYGPLNPASVTITIAPTNGTTSVNTTGAITYTPNAGFIGNDSFTYQVCSSTNPSLCDTALVSITVTVGAALPGLPQTGETPSTDSFTIPTLISTALIIAASLTLLVATRRLLRSKN